MTPDAPKIESGLIKMIRIGKSIYLNMRRVVRKPAFCICENKDADQLRGYREADQRLCFHYILPNLGPSAVTVQPGLCVTCSETPKTGTVLTRLIYGLMYLSLLFQIKTLLKTAATNRAVGETLLNERSSRSHSVFRLKLSGANEITGEKSQGRYH